MPLSCGIPDANGARSAKATLLLTNMRGLHARASNKFMEAVGQFDARVWVRSHNDVCAETVEADSVMELLLLGAACGEKITVTAQGEDAPDAIAAITALVKSRFGEEE
ncbi:HPr family phosphocarrier protein [Algimonas porphyrae]|uniref:Phosphocarrier protein HPr n=1 Tax=Algimonas porphyrae TaxID=1128113 RepID=A0ABQ5UXK7_9PROT|nr:HPr family phosphocarrier protein [Algimonas porphyrae]GLQ20040.1 phosphocarrier protein HPr [Algimonas porphyrae]